MTLLHKQRGSTLLVALVMLVLLTLIALSAMKATTTSIQIVGNAQIREEANTAAQQAIEGVISSNFTAAPAASSVAVAFGAANYTVHVDTPTCTSSLNLTNAMLNPAISADAACLGSGAATNTGIMISGVAAAPTGQSWCYQQNWDVSASVSDSNTGSSTTVHQGVFTRVPAGTECP